MHEFRFEPVRLPETAAALRSEVRAFIALEVANRAFTPSRNSWSSFDPDFSRKCGERGYIGMVWPREYGGHERSALERYVVTEEMLAGGGAGGRALGRGPAKRPSDSALRQRSREANHPAEDRRGRVLFQYRHERA